MPEQRKTIFISCGQSTDEEKALGEQVRKLVNESTPFEGYFAQNQISLKALSENVLSRLYGSVGLIAIMHCRGTVDALGRKLVRASVWVEQEVAIAALMEQVLHRPLHVALFIENGIEIEGMRKQLHLNPTCFTDAEEVTNRLREILPSWKEPRYISDDELQKRANSVDLSIRIVQGYHLSFTIDVTNHSDINVALESIILRSPHDGNLCDLCAPLYRPPNANWTIGAKASIPIQFTTSQDIGRLLATIYDRSRIKAVIQVELRCEILGIPRAIDKNCLAEVNGVTGQINGL